MSKLDNTPQPVREAIAAALMIGAVTATAATLLHQPLFLFGGLILFAIFYVARINPQVKAAYQEQEEQDRRDQHILGDPAPAEIGDEVGD